MMIRILVIFFIVNTSLSYSQDPILKLKYTQTVFKDGQQVEGKPTAGFMNVFQPTMMNFTESGANMEIDIKVQKNVIFIQSTIDKSDGFFSTKYQIDDEAYALNLLTGEKKQFGKTRRIEDIDQLLDKLKLKKDNANHEFIYESEFYKSKIGSKELKMHVSKHALIDVNTGLFCDFFYNGKIVLEKRLFDRERNKETIVKLISIDTLEGSTNLVDLINSNQELNIDNKKLQLDSIAFNQEIPDIYYKEVSDGAVVSLNKYKGNGKYLLVDFWGTWCKPCLASIHELEAFYEKHADKLDLLSMNYKDSNLNKIKAKIEETGMYWPQGIATEKVNKVLNPESHFPGIILFDDKMNLVLRDKAKKGLKAAEIILQDLK